MLKNIGEFIRTRCVAIDVFDNPLKAVEQKRGIYIDESLEEFLNSSKKIRENTELQEMVLNSRYWENKKILKAMFSYARRKLGKTVGGAKIFVSVPQEYLRSSYDGTWGLN